MDSDHSCPLGTVPIVTVTAAKTGAVLRRRSLQVQELLWLCAVTVLDGLQAQGFA